MIKSHFDNVPTHAMDGAYDDTERYAQPPPDPPERSAVADWDDAHLTHAATLIGSVLGDEFAIRSVIGHGAFGRVYLAEQLSLRREVAVKVLRFRHAANSTVVRRFCDEARAASQLRHPNVVSIYDYGRTDDGLLYIAMEHLRGRTLRTLLASGRRLPPERAVSLFAPVLRGLEEAHTAGVVHADLKPDNIFVHLLRDGGELVKIIDFGVARVLREDPAAAAGPLGPRGPIRITGTPEYMAPELLCGAPHTPAADIYAAGMVLYELLTGRLPFTGADPVAILERQRDEPVPSLSRGCSEAGIPPSLERVVMRALAKDPSQRFRSATAFVSALAEVEVRPIAIVCERCGVGHERRARFCAECGARMTTQAYAPHSRQQTERDRAQAARAFDRGETAAALDILRRAVGRSIRLGQPTLILDCYAALSDLLVRSGAPDQALRELEEGVALVTGGDPDAATEVPPGLWQVHLQQAELYHRCGHCERALMACERALRRARQSESARGESQARALAERLRSAPTL